MRSNRKNYRKEKFLLSAAGGVAIFAAPVFAGTTVDPNTGLSEVTISISGSTALKNFITSQGFTDLLPGSSITLDLGGTVGMNTTLTAGSQSLELAPVSDTGIDTATSDNALRVEYHESGSVEGILEMADDQIGAIPYVEDNINRDPNSGNAVWVNGNQIGGAGGPPGNQLAIGENNPGGNYLGPFYGATSSGVVPYGPGVNATFSMTGQNISAVTGSGYTQAGQNAVQVAISDVVPVQAFANDYSSPSTTATVGNVSTPWFSSPSNYGYGMGNTALQSGGLGVAGGGVNLQSSSYLDMPANAINPRTGTTFGVGPWNTGGLANVNSQTTAVSATLFVANPGTGLDRLDQTDAQWLETTGRLANGAAFDMTTRDVNSGTRNVAALDAGIDPSWAVGVDDSGNGNLATGASTQIDIGSQKLTAGVAPVNIGTIRFSNKTAGGAQLRPTVQNARMAVGTLSVGDANSVFTAGNSYGLRALDYSPGASATGTPYVQVSAYAIINGTYALYQNEQFVTLKSAQAQDVDFSSMTAAQWADVATGGTVAVDPTMGSSGSVPIQGDDSTGAVSQVIDNVQTSIATLGLGGFDSSSIAYVSKGFILPDMMQVEKAENGMPSSPTGNNPALGNQLLASSFTTDTTGSDPDSVVAVAGNSYGGKNSGGQTFDGSIGQTTYNNALGTNDGGNWLFGNFNQNGIRDFDSVVVSATDALAVLENAEDQNNGGAFASASAFSGISNNTDIGAMAPVTINGITYTMPASLALMTNNNSGVGATKGDLIMMGDFDGRGVFDGQSLYEMAVDCSLTDNVIGTKVLAGVNDHLTLQAENITVLAANTNTGSGGSPQTAVAVGVNTETFGDAVRRGVLNKNTALDYLNIWATPQMKAEAAAILTVVGNSSNVPHGATDLGNVSGNEYFTYDPNGVNAYNPSDVNRDGVVDFNDAILVDNNNGKSYSNLANQLTATQQSPVYGNIEPLDLVMAQQVDGEAAIGSADVTVMNSALTANGNANWYDYNLQKTGPGTLVWGRTAGTVTVYTGSSFEISGGNVQVSGAVDPFTDNNTSGPTAGNHVAVAVDGGGELQLTNGRTTTVAGLTVDLASHSRVDVGSSALAIDFGAPGSDPVSHIVSYLSGGYASGAWTGTAGIISSTAAASAGSATLLSVGYADGNVDNGSGSSTLAAAAANQVLIRMTIAGDADLNGSVDFSDLFDVGKHLNTTGNDWASGNFTYAGNGAVDFTDLFIIGQNLNKTLGGDTWLDAPTNVVGLGATIQTTVVPEPTTLALGMIAGTGLLMRRKRRAVR